MNGKLCTRSFPGVVSICVKTRRLPVRDALVVVSDNPRTDFARRGRGLILWLLCLVCANEGQGIATIWRDRRIRGR